MLCDGWEIFFCAGDAADCIDAFKRCLQISGIWFDLEDSELPADAGSFSQNGAADVSQLKLRLLNVSFGLCADKNCVVA